MNPRHLRWGTHASIEPSCEGGCRHHRSTLMVSALVKLQSSPPVKEGAGVTPVVGVVGVAPASIEPSCEGGCRRVSRVRICQRTAGFNRALL